MINSNDISLVLIKPQVFNLHMYTVESMKYGRLKITGHGNQIKLGTASFIISLPQQFLHCIYTVPDLRL